ncbi:MAG: MBL fold metallo-hydrolase [Candidatus Vogelbacteria bacterium]|nr:MBL fold metallo-hydrolase [Candidatus Vogelbacteria bacterium]
MKITKFEQSGFVLETDQGYKLAVDIGSYTPIEKLDGLSVDAVLVSHLHGDHFSLEHIKQLKPKKLFLNRECLEIIGEENLDCEIIEIKTGDRFNIEDIQVTVFDVDHGPNTKVKPRENFGFLMTVDEQKLYFAGDMFYPSGLQVTDLEVQYALIPVGTFYTFGPTEALEFIKQFKKIEMVVPMHYEKIEETKTEFMFLAKNSGFNII